MAADASGLYFQSANPSAPGGHLAEVTPSGTLTVSSAPFELGSTIALSEGKLVVEAPPGPNGKGLWQTWGPSTLRPLTSSAPRRQLVSGIEDTGAGLLGYTKPAGAKDIYVESVSCTSPRACTAVGYYGDGPGALATLAEVWNGTTWAIQKTPNPAGASSLNGVSCTSPTACTAVGTEIANRSGVLVALAEAWDGTTWSVQETGSPEPIDSLEGVSCSSSSACTAVGYGSRGALAEAWDGTSWSVQKTPNQAGFDDSLEGVSCTSPSACTAVGYGQDGAGTLAALAEEWDGATWAFQKTPDPTQTSLGSVSCTSPTACTAVGSDAASMSTGATLSEAWDGTTWAVQETPNPTWATDGDLLGVSCASSSACTAVGDYTDNSATNVTLAETEKA